MSENWVTTEQAAEYLQKPVSWLYHNAKRHKIPRTRIGKQYRYRLSDLDRWLEQA